MIGLEDAKGFQIKLMLNRADFALAVDLQLPTQGVTVLFGPSGSGKTTILRCVAGLEKAAGHIVVAGQTWQDTRTHIHLPTWQRDLGYVFQEASLFEHLSVEKNLQFGVKRVRKPEAARALAQAIELLGIEHLLKRSPASLSGGERQRVAIARALAMQPKLLLLDEPLASLDQVRREEILPWLERLHADLKIPVLYVTHSMHELTRLADHVVLLNQGSVKLQGPIQSVLADPTFAALVGGEAGAILQGQVAAHDETYHLTRIDLVANETAAGQLWMRQQLLPLKTRVRVHVHANDVSLSLLEPVGTSIQNRMRGVIESITPDMHPANRIVTVNCDGQLVLARVTARALDELGLEAGAVVWCQIKSVALAGR
ncbi:molybdenum ABC transporter ATP-binding protein [Orrella daihaiensis]|uniref:Molybdenum ABC transporter ATP-binding protein n=1 Tax=Orrella daihaiensis TaxID=2782176 RepID=A0ABY4ALE4_9BURK|nr:molybdenum ABC transporter ATP-binding protein [Orrella daihaiensis]UOD50994.1 molybdenum ABC transporter ATP-binding protein [Orrella daihaiensis]